MMPRMSIHRLRKLVQEEEQIPDWLVAECVRACGSVTETICLLLEGEHTRQGTSVLDALRALPLEERRAAVRAMTGPRTRPTKAPPPPWTELPAPLVVRCVILHAHVVDRRVETFTLGLWKDSELVPLVRMRREEHPEIEAMDVDRIIESTTVLKNGPIRTVTPTIVMDIAIDALRVAPRRKCGVDVRSATYVRTVHDAVPGAISTLAPILSLDI